VGKASRSKPQRKEQNQRPQDGPPPGRGRTLLALLTKEPFQPIRLYFAVPGREEVLAKLINLRCIDTDPAEEGCWPWLFDAESEALPIGAGYGAVPPARRPLVLGRIRFPRDSLMTLDTNSTDRAVEGARFFARQMGAGSTLIRVRVVNRLFSGEDGEQGGIQGLMTMLDQNVTVIDPREAEARMRQDFQGVYGPEAFSQALEAQQRKIMETGGDDVPLVEDFPLAPEEETPDFAHLRMTLTLRAIRAMEHWRGNTEVTLPRLIIGMCTGRLDFQSSDALKDALKKAASGFASLV
jgi:hypothetical protein